MPKAKDYEPDHEEGVDILVAEDSATQAEQLRFLLEQQGHRVRVATNGKLALAAVHEHRPTIVITDIVMPEMNGFELCTAIKTDPELRHIPVIIVTSLTSLQDISRSLECGADNFIRKPYEPKTMLARIKYILLNLELRRNSRVQMGMEIFMGGKKHYISSEREQILDLLISTYEEAVQMNEELQAQQRDIALSNRTLRVLYQISGQLNRVSSEREVCEQTLQGILKLPGFLGGWVWLEDGPGRMRTLASRSLPAALQAQTSFDQACECLRQQGTDRKIEIVECSCVPAAAKATGRHATNTYARVPLKLNDQCLGLMNVVGEDRGAFPEERLRLLEAVASQTALAIQRAQLYQHLEELVAQRTAALQAEVLERTRAEQKIAGLNRIYAMLSAINTTIVRVHDRQELFREACRIAVELGGFQLAWVGQLEDDGRRMKPLVWVGAENDPFKGCAPAVVDEIAVGPGLLARAIEQHTVMTCKEAVACGVEIFANEESPWLCRSRAVLPLVEGSQAVGVLALYAKEAGVFEDESELKLLREIAGDISFALGYIKKEEQLHHLAFYDAVTGLPNRTLVHDRLNQLLQAHALQENDDTFTALVIVNIERFKTINDTLGRHVGDKVLKRVADRLVNAFKHTDRIGRIGGDHFAVILSGLTDASEVVHILDQAHLTELGQPFLIDGQELRLALRFGVALYPSDAQHADSLFANAETALRKASVSQERCIFYAPEMNARVSEKLLMENRLHRALERDEFLLHYQPKVDAQNGRIVGLEALVRWKDPEKGLVSPAAFIPVLEETGLIVEVGQRVIEKALYDISVWHAAGLEVPRVAVNVSAVQLRRKDFVFVLEQILAAHPQERAYLDLELTESMLMQDIEATIRQLTALREMGLRIAIDDFGTGYSSLNYLKRLPIDQLKIDQSFVREITTDGDAAAICTAVIGLGHNLRMQVIAEGVETKAQMQYLREQGCDQMQGYLFSRPIVATECAKMLLAQKDLVSELSASGPILAPHPV